jgi:hypothetical protein
MLCKNCSERVPSVHFDGNDEIPSGQYCKKCAKELGFTQRGKWDSVSTVILIWLLMPILDLPLMYELIDPLYQAIENYGLRMFVTYLIEVSAVSIVPIIGKTVFKVPLKKSLLITLIVLPFFTILFYYLLFFYILLAVVSFPDIRL